jgi:hypothetical protein
MAKRTSRSPDQAFHQLSFPKRRRKASRSLRRGPPSVQKCSLLPPVRLRPPCRRPILIATKYLVFRGRDTRIRGRLRFWHERFRGQDTSTREGGDSPSSFCSFARSFCRRSTSKPYSPYADSKVHASVSVNRKKARKFLTRSRPRTKKKEFRRCVFFMITLFNNVLIWDYYLSDETRGIRLASMSANRNQALRDRLFLVRLAVIAVRMANWLPVSVR